MKTLTICRDLTNRFGFKKPNSTSFIGMFKRQVKNCFFGMFKRQVKTKFSFMLCLKHTITLVIHLLNLYILFMLTFIKHNNKI